MLIPDKFYRLLLGLSFAALAVIASINISSSGNFFSLLLFLSVPFIILLFLKPHLAILLAIALHGSMATLPMLPNSLNLSRLLILVFLIGKIIAHFIRPSGDKDGSPKMDIPPLLYAGIVTAMLFIHGFGMKSLGSQMQGGGAAIAQLLLVALFLFRNIIALTKKQIFTGIIIMCIASSAPLIADAAFVFSRGNISAQFLFIEPLLNALRMAMNEGGSSVWRLQRAVFLAPSIVELSFLLKYAKIGGNRTFVALVLLSLFVLGISGHRGAVIEMLAFAVFFMLFWKRKGRIQTIVFMLLGVSSAYFLLWIATPLLPITFQRVVSFIPGLHISEIASNNASGTLEWRMEFWQYILLSWREYIWFGTGFLHDPILIESLETRSLIYKMYYGINLPDHVYGMAVKDYHNGPIALLADMGIFGFITGIWLIFHIIREQISAYTRTIFVDSGMKALQTLLVAKLCTETFVFFFVFGDVRSMLEILFLGSIAAAIVNCNARQQVTGNTNGVNASEGVAT